MSEDPARNRFFAIQAMRWIGTLVALFGLLVIYRRIDLPVEAGYVIFVVGLLDALVAPSLLARRWKSPLP
ncbi:hypothetical protein WG901_01360 [Novosphingobium sp. PS1R-30]|uniref:Uncharacterized protein n=1 Tax=Novosphingobium anseongense TaxID=3133436 RepID=A0ABU8RQA3_9SPHN